MLAALLTDFSQINGVEILKDLHDTSVEVLQNYRKLLPQEKTAHHSIKLIHGDFQEVDFSDADVIFMNATCMKYEITLPLVRKFEKLKKGARVITSTRFFESEYFIVKDLGSIEFTWGEEECFIHEKMI